MLDGFLQDGRQLVGILDSPGRYAHGFGHTIEAQLWLRQVHSYELTAARPFAEILEHVELENAIRPVAQHDISHWNAMVRRGPQGRDAVHRSAIGADADDLLVWPGEGRAQGAWQPRSDTSTAYLDQLSRHLGRDRHLEMLSIRHRFRKHQGVVGQRAFDLVHEPRAADRAGIPVSAGARPVALVDLRNSRLCLHAAFEGGFL